MTIILPYNKEFETGEGGFIKPDGEVLWSGCRINEQAATEYCDGPDLFELRELIHDYKNGKMTSETEYIYERFLSKNPDFKGTIADIDEYDSSKLSKEELDLYLKWLYEAERFYKVACYFLTYVLEFDEVETIYKAIYTSSDSAFTRFKEYALNGWHIVRKDKQYWNSEKQCFDIYDTEESYQAYMADRIVEAEVRRTLGHPSR